MKKKQLITLLVLFAIVLVEGKKLSKSRSSSSGRGSNRKTNNNPQPTSMSQPQASAPKPSLFAWQEKPAQRSQTSSRQSQPSNSGSHSYPSSNTGLSGNSQAKQPSSHQESVQKSNIQQNFAGQQSPPHTAAQPQGASQAGHAYPSSNGLSGNTGTGAGYPPGSGLSGSGAAAPSHSGGSYPSNNFGSNNQHAQGAPPPYSSSGVGYPRQQGTGLSGPAAAAPPYSGGHYPANNYGNNYHHPPPPPPYTNYGGYGGHGSYNPMQSPQMPGYFGNYGGGRGFGGPSRTSSALKGVGIAGAGVGTLLTGLALWNLARSTGQHRHTVIYDNRGQPVAVAPNDSTAPVVDPMLGDLFNCTLTISGENATEVLAIPCAIATSFSPEADVKDAGSTNSANDNTKCTVTVVTKTGKEYMTTIPCSILLNTAAENNVTEPPLLHNEPDIGNGTMTGHETIIGNGTIITPAADTVQANEPSPLKLAGVLDPVSTNLNCTPELGDVRDPINPCYSVLNNLTVIPVHSTIQSSSTLLTTPSVA